MSSKIDNKTNNPTDFQEKYRLSVGFLFPRWIPTDRIGNIILFQQMIVAVEHPKKIIKTLFSENGFFIFHSQITIIISEIILWKWRKNSNFALDVYKKHNRYDSTSIVVVDKASGKYKEIKSIGNSKIFTAIELAYTVNHRRANSDTVRMQDFIYFLHRDYALLYDSIDEWIVYRCLLII